MSDSVSSRLPPLRTAADLADLERQRKDAALRGVSSIPAMREAIRRAAQQLPVLHQVPRLRIRDAAAFRRQAELGLPFLIDGIVGRWPLTAITAQTLRADYGDLAVRARVGDYIANAFAPDRAMRDLSLRAYLDLTDDWPGALPPY